jgi:hypothetical protein
MTAAAHTIHADSGESVGFEEQCEDPIVLRLGQQWPGAGDQLAVVADRGGERRRQRSLELGPHRVHDLANQIGLGCEVVDDDPVADAEPLAQPPERQLAETVVERCCQRTVEDLCLGVLVTHPSDGSHLVVLLL